MFQILKNSVLTAATVLAGLALCSTTTHAMKVSTIGNGVYDQPASVPVQRHNIKIRSQVVHHRAINKTQVKPTVKAEQTQKPLTTVTPMNQANEADVAVVGDTKLPANDNIAKTAEQMIGYFNYGQVRPVANYVTKSGHQLHDINDVDPNGMTDCSGFVWLTLKVAGYNVGGFAAGSTENMRTLTGGWGDVLEEIPQNQARAGDIVVVSDGIGNAGHTGILDGDYHGNDLVDSDTPFVNVSGGNHACVKGPIKWYFSYLKTLAPTHVFRVKPSAHINNY